jgi:nucleotide sugar dehydrogenase
VKRVVVVGLGYVGLPSAVCLAKAGYHVTGADINASAVAALNAGRSPLKDSLGDEEIRPLVEAGAFEATTDTAAAVRMADLVLVCVPTPVDHGHKPDLGPLHKSSVAIGRGLQPGTVVSYESTTFPGCTERECIPLLERESGLKAGEDFGVAYCPERLNPGDDAHTTEVTPRVLGALDERSYRVAESVYNSFLAVPVHKCRDIRTAEASKVLENVQRDVNIALMNEFAMMCPALGLDVHEVLKAARTKFNFVRVDPGPGVGGHCIPVDPWYLIEEARAHGIEPGLMVTARRVNDAATDAVADAILGQLAGKTGAKVAVLGAAYKGGVGDLRESPALRIVDLLRPKVRFLSVHDPYVEKDALRTATHADPATVEEAIRDADAIALVTDHPEFKGLDWTRLASLAKPGAAVIDARNLVDPPTAAASGLRYWGIGRSST